MVAVRTQRGTTSGWWRLVVLLLLLTGPLQAEATSTKAARSRRATTSAQARRQAIEALPLRGMARGDRQAVQQVVRNTSIYRRLPTTVVDCSPLLFGELLKHPEVITELWQEMGISKMDVRRTGANDFDVSDGAGTRARLRLVHDSFDKRVIVGSGIYDGPALPRPLRARCVLLVQSRALQETDGRDYITCRMDSFLQVDGPAVELLAKAFQPLLGKTADHNFVETLNFVSKLHQTAEAKPEAVARVIQRLEDVEPVVLKRVASVCHQVGAEVGEPPRILRVRTSTR